MQAKLKAERRVHCRVLSAFHPPDVRYCCQPHNCLPAHQSSQTGTYKERVCLACTIKNFDVLQDEACIRRNLGVAKQTLITQKKLTYFSLLLHEACLVTALAQHTFSQAVALLGMVPAYTLGSSGILKVWHLVLVCAASGLLCNLLA